MTVRTRDLGPTRTRGRRLGWVVAIAASNCTTPRPGDERADTATASLDAVPPLADATPADGGSPGDVALVDAVVSDAPGIDVPVLTRDVPAPDVPVVVVDAGCPAGVNTCRESAWIAAGDA